MNFRKIKSLLFIIFIGLFAIRFNKYCAHGYEPNGVLDDNIGEICKICEYDDENCILVSRADNLTKISKLNIRNNDLCLLKELKINCKYCHYYNDKIYILSAPSNEDDSFIGQPSASTIVYVYDLQNERIISRFALMQSITSEDQFCIDNNGRIYYIYQNDTIKSVLPGGADEKTFYEDGPISSINFNLDKEILYSISIYNPKVTCYSKSGEIISYNDNNNTPHGKITFLSDNEIVDELNYLYKIGSDGLSFTRKIQLIPRGKFYTALRIKDKIASFDGESKLYVFDGNNYSLLGTISIENNMLCASTNDLLLSICRDNSSYAYYILDLNSYEKAEIKIIKETDNLFEFSPQSGVYEEVDLDDNYCWSLKLKDGLLIDEYSNLKVSILDTGSGVTSELTLDNGIDAEDGIIKIIPLNISYNNLFHYILTVSGLCDKIGNPCLIKHELELYYNIPKLHDYFISSNVYNIDYEKLLITGISPGTSVAAFKRNFNVKGYDILLLDNKGVEKTSGNVGTGKSISFIRDGKTEYKFKIIIYGDINGSGNISSKDLYDLRNYLLGNLKLSEDYLMAADINHDGKVDTIDLLCLSEYLAGDYEIIQKQ